MMKGKAKAFIPLLIAARHRNGEPVQGAPGRAWPIPWRLAGGEMCPWRCCFPKQGAAEKRGAFCAVMEWSSAIKMIGRAHMQEYTYVSLRQRPELAEKAAAWFHDKWAVPREDYLACMEAYLNQETEYGWYLCLDRGRIAGGLGVIENDFHDRKDLAPNVCAVYTDREYRCQGIAGRLLDLVVRDMRSKGIAPLYLATDHTGFYERYGWEFLCMVQESGAPSMVRMYIHR